MRLVRATKGEGGRTYVGDELDALVCGSGGCDGGFGRFVVDHVVLERSLLGDVPVREVRTMYSDDGEDELTVGQRRSRCAQTRFR